MQKILTTKKQFQVEIVYSNLTHEIIYLFIRTDGKNSKRA